MTRTSAHPASLATLIDALVAFIQDRGQPHLALPQSLPPEQLARVFETFEHHLVALSLVARSDAKVAAAERDVIFRHCVRRAQMAGREMTSAEEDALRDYLRHFRPAMQHMTPMLERLKHDTKGEIGGLIAAAHALVEADGVVRLQELSYLASLQRDLLAL